MATISWEAIEARTLSLDVSDLPQWVVQPPCSARRAMARPSSARPSTARPSFSEKGAKRAATVRAVRPSGLLRIEEAEYRRSA